MDEPIQRKHGMVAFEYVNNLFDLYASAPQVTGENLSNYDHRDYGMFFQFVAYSLEPSLGIDNSKDVFLLRHLMVFLLFWVGLILFFLALKSRFQNQTLALLGILCIILSPRIFGDSFYNPKDIPLLSWFMIGIYSFVRFVKKPSLNNIIIHAFVAALCIGSRIVGILIPVIFGFWLLSNYFYLDKEYKLKHILIQLTVYFTFLILFTFSLWPVLWENPITSFLYSFQSMSQFRWSGSMLYMGELIHSSSIPWHYAPVWIAVTSPIAILVLFLSGIFSTVFEIKVKGAAFLSERNNRIDLAITLLFFGPLLAVIQFNSVLYNGWRHLYFIYPAMIWISIRGLKSLWEYSSVSKKSKWITYVIIV
jgi:hypothetical protein